MARTKKRLKIIIMGHRDSLSYLILSRSSYSSFLFVKATFTDLPKPCRSKRLNSETDAYDGIFHWVSKYIVFKQNEIFH